MTYDPNASDKTQQPKTVTMSREDINRLEKRAKKNDERDTELAQLKRERDFLAAGVPLTDPRAEYFVAGYKGDQTPEAIKAEWESKFGGPPAGHQGTGQEHIDVELGQLSAAQDLTTAAPNITPDKLAERDQKLAALSDTDPHYDQKFRAIFESYGGKSGGLVG